MKTIYSFYVVVIFWSLMALATLFSYFRDKKIFGREIAKKNTYHFIKYAAIPWIYLSVSSGLALIFIDFKGSEIINKIIMLLYLGLPVFIWVVTSRIICKLYGQERVGSRMPNSKLVSFTASHKSAQPFNLFGYSLVAVMDFFDFVANSRTDLLLVYLILAGLLIFALALPLLDKVELRERGIYGSYFAIQWDEIETYKLEQKDNMLHIQHKSIWPISRHLVFQVSKNGREEIMALLESYLPHCNSE
jgi:hypothetical protein